MKNASPMTITPPSCTVAGNFFIKYSSAGTAIREAFWGSHVWRPREYNKLSDRVCNWILKDRANLERIDMERVRLAMQHGACLQISSDGGFKEGVGAAAIAVVLIIGDVLDIDSRTAIASYMAKHWQQACSAFQMELIAAEMAILFVET